MSRVQVPDAFQFLWTPSRYKAVYGGRGSAKSHSIALALVTQAASQTLRCLCCREIQNSIQDSVKQLLDDKIRACGLSHFFTSTKTDIVGVNGSRFMFAGLRTNADSIKSMEGIDRAWVEEASRVSQRSWDLLIPTIRKNDSEIWASWNPESEYDPVDKMFRGKHVSPHAIVRRVSYSDNPFFPDVLRQEMEFDRASDPEKAAHVWDGAYMSAPKGAYYAKLLAEARVAGRLGNVPHDPILETHVSFDLGNGPNMAMWFSQWVGREVRVIDYLQGDEEAASAGWPWYIKRLREKPYSYGEMILPHDARSRQRVTGKGDEQTLIEAGFRTRVVDKMDPGERVKLVQRFLPICWIDEPHCGEGLRAMNNYTSDYDEKMRVDRGPLHNWASHPADAFGHLAQAYDEPTASKPKARERIHGHAQGWMG